MVGRLCLKYADGSCALHAKAKSLIQFEVLQRNSNQMNQRTNWFEHYLQKRWLAASSRQIIILGTSNSPHFAISRCNLGLFDLFQSVLIHAKMQGLEYRVRHFQPWAKDIARRRPHPFPSKMSYSPLESSSSTLKTLLNICWRPQLFQAVQKTK